MGKRKHVKPEEMLSQISGESITDSHLNKNIANKDWYKNQQEKLIKDMRR